MLLGLEVARAQGPGYSPSTGPMLPPGTPGMEPANPGATVDGAMPGPTTTAAVGQGGAMPTNVHGPLSDWLLYPRSPGCCGPVGGNGPIGSELFLRVGVVFPFGGSTLEKSLRDGWDIDGGVRALFFDIPQTHAWTISLGVSNIFNDGQGNPPPVTLHNVKTGLALPTGQSASSANSQAAQAAQALGLPSSVLTQLTSQIPTTQGVTVVLPTVNASVASYNQTFFNLAGGRVWYLMGSGDCSYKECKWRIGWEGGGRWGTSKVEFNEIRHLTDTVGGMFTALYSDLEYPCQCAILQAGFRTEYQFIWGDPLQRQNEGNYQSVNLLLTAGVRF
jgi:hypothetical protein